MYVKVASCLINLSLRKYDSDNRGREGGRFISDLYFKEGRGEANLADNGGRGVLTPPFMAGFTNEQLATYRGTATRRMFKNYIIHYCCKLSLFRAVALN